MSDTAGGAAPARPFRAGVRGLARAGSRRLPRARALARRVVARAQRSHVGRVRHRLRRPEVSVVVPFYNVEEYIASCLDSVVEQSLTDIEVLLVDDSSPDGSRAIAEQYAARDPRLRILTRPNGGLGAARNTGVRAARGRFLTFVDSDDELPPDALARLVDSAHRSDADIVVGSVERFDSIKTWNPAWVKEVHGRTRTGIGIEEFLPLLRNLYTWDKLYRRDWYLQQDLWFREGVAYEDQPIVTQLLARARSIDVIPDVVYRYRARDDQSSISQQTATVKDLRHRVAAWRVSRDVIQAEMSQTVYDGWLQTLFDAHFHWYLQSPGTVDDTYWRELVAAVRELAVDAPEHVWLATAPAQRVLVQLALQDRRADAQEFVRGGAFKSERWPSRIRDDGVLLELPLVGDPSLPDELFVIRPEQLWLAHAIEKLHMVVGDAGDVSGQVSGWAFVRHVDLSQYESVVSVVMVDQSSGREHVTKATARPSALFTPPVDDIWCDYAPGTFGVTVPVSKVLATASPGTEWAVLLRVEVAGFTVTREVNRLIRSGSAGVVPAVALPTGGRLITDWRYGAPLVLRTDVSGARVGGLELSHRTVTGTLTSAGGAGIVEVIVGTRGELGTGRVDQRGDRREFEVTLPAGRGAADGTSLDWTVHGRSEDGRRVPLVTDAVVRHQMSDDVAGGQLALESDRNGELVVREWSLGAEADRVDVTDGVLTVTGRVYGAGAARVRIRTVDRRSRSEGEPVDLGHDGRFVATTRLEHTVYRFGQRPLGIGDHRLHLVVDGRAGVPAVAIPLLVSAELNDQLPVALLTLTHEGRVVRGPAAVAQVTLQRPLGPARGRYQQRQLRTDPPRAEGLTRGILFRSYFGEQATDNGLSIQRELARRGSDLPVYWAVQDHAVVVPDGGIPVVVNTREWYALLASVRYYVDNMYQPEYHHKPEGQVIAQTFHGYPFKKMGHPHWRNVQFSQAQIESYDARARDWDFLVSPARYATELLRRDFAYPGEMLEIGYPRNDVLRSAEADDIRAAVRTSLGIAEHQTAVLYAPTFRDYLAAEDSRAFMAGFFDFVRARQRLGDDTVILIRGHAFNARSQQRIGNLPGCVDVTDYPEVSDLYLASDAAIVDYSSLRFDYGVTGKPMIFHVPDLQRYQDTRGWLFDFEATAPGPLVATTDEVVDHLLDLDGVRRDFASAYQAFHDDYLDLDDGQAGRRFVDAVIAPRGDA